MAEWKRGQNLSKTIDSHCTVWVPLREVTLGEVAPQASRKLGRKAAGGDPSWHMILEVSLAAQYATARDDGVHAAGVCRLLVRYCRYHQNIKGCKRASADHDLRAKSLSELSGTQ